MNLHAFYNLEGVGDVLLVRLEEGVTSKYETHNDLVVLYDSNNLVIGYNLLQASSYFSDLKKGLVKIDEQFVKTFNQILIQYNLQTVESDYRPTFVVGKVISLEDHPDSDHLHVCQVDLGNETTQIVCGASNVSNNQLVVVATVGSVMPSGMLIKPSFLRKVASDGMLCSARELMLPGAADVPGILLLDEKEYKVGQPFLF